jgi:hypothetical protein
MLQQKFDVQVTTLPDCDDITRFDGTSLGIRIQDGGRSDPDREFIIPNPQRGTGSEKTT